LKSVETAWVGHGIHFLQEDNPEAIGRAVAEWLRRVVLTAPRGG
jgi:haloalkane dehalogenase